MADSTVASEKSGSSAVAGYPSMSLEESRRTVPVILGLVVLQALLAVWWWVFVVERHPFKTLQESNSQDARGHSVTGLVLVGLLSLLGLILSLTQVERAAERRSWSASPAASSIGRARHLATSRAVLRRLGAWVVLIDFGAALLVLLLVSFWGPKPLLLEALAVVVVLAIAVSFCVSIPLLVEDDDSTADGVRSSGAQSSGVQNSSAQNSGAQGGGEDSGDRFTLALSGGGIRAAAFALGVYQALSRHPAKNALTPGEPRLVAVSGGSYLAASLALVRRFHAQEGKEARSSDKRATDLAWSEAYELGSPEMHRLRRHTRDLVEPLKNVVGGVLTLVCGAIVNLVILVGLVWLAAWLLSWAYSTLGILRVDFEPRSGGSVLTLVSPLLHHWIHNRVLFVVSAPLAVLLLLFVVLSVLIYGAQRDTERAEVNSDGSLSNVKRWRWLTQARVWAAGLLMGWIVVVVLIPLALKGLAQAAMDNQPNETVAGAIASLGFSTEQLCNSAASEDLDRAYAEARARARLSPSAKQAINAGACGSSVPVSVESASANPVGVRPVDRLYVYEKAVVTGGSGPNVPFAAKITALATLLSAGGVALRRVGGNPDAPLTGWRARLRRFLLAWLPLGVAASILVWFFLSQIFALTVSSASLATLRPTLWVVLALAFATWTDANITSLHSFYRQRLSSAFAVGRSHDGSSAGPLTAEQIFKFSELGSIPLHVVTTANVRAYDQVPTRRGGLPFVLSNKEARLATVDGDITANIGEYEKRAGAARVSVMAAVATSGAAVSPMAGRFASTVAPFRILLTVFNVRVGSWVLNPAWSRPVVSNTAAGGTGTSHRTLWQILRGWPATPWLIARPGASQVLLEAVGQSSVEDRWLYLSDGGHFDNTGLVEAVRLHRNDSHPLAGRILVVDASNDTLGSWSAVGDAMAVVRAEFEVELECILELNAGSEASRRKPDSEAESSWSRWWRRVQPVQTPQATSGEREDTQQTFMRLYRGRGRNQSLEVMVVKAVRPEGLEGLPEPLRSFVLSHPQFPRASTTRQDFGDLEFEAYRALGEFYASKSLTLWVNHLTNREVAPEETT